MAENIDININATGNANRVFAQLDKQVSGLNNQFAFLKRAIAGLAVGNFIQNAFKMADAIDDIAKSTGLATQTVMGFGQAVQANGGTIEGAQNALSRFAQTIGEARDGGKGAITAFNEVGVSLNDLATLSEQDLLAKVVAGLGQISDKSKQARLSTELLGKSIKGVDFTGVAQGFDAAVKASGRYAASNKAAADANQNIQAGLQVFQQELLRTLQPISELVGNINTAGKEFKAFISALLDTAMAVAGLFAAFRVFQGIRFVWTNIGIIRETLKGLGIELKDLANPKNWAWIGSLGERFKKSIKNIQDYQKELGKNISKGQNDELNETIRKTEMLAQGWEKATSFVKKFAAAVGLTGLFSFNYDQALKEPTTDRKRTAGRPGGGRGVPDTTAASENLERLNKAYTDGQAKVDAYTNSLQKEFDAISQNINVEREALQIGEKAAEVKRVIQQVTDKVTDAEERYQEMKQGLDPKNENDKKLIDYINAQIVALNKKGEAAKKAGKEAVEALQKERAAYEEVLFQIEQYNTKLDNEEALRQIREEGELIGLVGEELEKKRQQIELERRERAALNQLQKEENKLKEEYNRLTVEGKAAEADAYAKALDRINKRRQDVKDQYKAEREELDKNEAKQESMMDDFLKGIRDRLKVIKEDESLYNLGDKLAQSLEKAIDEFVTTGKFKFKEFAAAALREWLAMKAKMALMDVFDGLLSKVKDIFGSISGAGGGGGGSKGFLSGFFGNLLKSFLPGFADGGVPPINKPSIVGERGPELFVPKQTGTVVPSEMLASMNKPSAPITNNYNTYNINALDAKSVATLFAENRKAIFGANKMAEREMSYAGAR